MTICVFFCSCVKEVFNDFTFRSHYLLYGALLWSLDDVDMAHIDRLGLSSLCQILVVLVNYNLLTALVEHFHLEKNTFYLLQGEMIVTPEEIYKILHIPFHGSRVVYDKVPRVGTEALCAIF